MTESDMVKFIEFYTLMRDSLMMSALSEYRQDVESGIFEAESGIKGDGTAPDVQRWLKSEVGRGMSIRNVRIFNFASDVNIIELMHVGIRGMHVPSIIAALLDGAALIHLSGCYPKYQRDSVSTIVRLLTSPKDFFGMVCKHGLVSKYEDDGVLPRGLEEAVRMEFSEIENVGGMSRDETIETVNKHIVGMTVTSDRTLVERAMMYPILYKADKSLRAGSHQVFYRRKYYHKHPCFKLKVMSAFHQLRKYSEEGHIAGTKKFKLLAVSVSEDDMQKHPFGTQLCDRPLWAGQALAGLAAARRKFMCLKTDDIKATEVHAPSGVQEIIARHFHKTGERLTITGEKGVMIRAPDDWGRIEAEEPQSSGGEQDMEGEAQEPQSPGGGQGMDVE
jgi:hypothetical protein